MKSLYFTFLAAFLTITATAQSELPHVEDKQLTYLLPVGISYEIGISRLNTFRLSGPLDGGFLYEMQTGISGGTVSELHYFVRSAIIAEFRHYYNLDKRQTKGKRVDKNSGNFIAPIALLTGPAIIKSDNMDVANFSAVIGGIWGIHRNYGKSFNFQFSLGPGLGLADGEVSFVPVGGLSLGFRIGK